MSSDSTLPSIGAHCSLSSCNVNDFLPIRCKCDHLYCRDHIAPDTHHCPLLQVHPSPSAPSFSLQRCAMHICNKPSLESSIADPTVTANRSAAVCPGCKRAFCAQHRDPNDHWCTPAVKLHTGAATEKNAAARALLAKHFGSSSVNPTVRRPPSKPSSKKDAQQRQLAVMKMRHKAQPGNPKDSATSTPMDERLHVKVSQVGVPTSERVFWFPKTVGAGKALDLLATHFNMAISDSQPLKLLYEAGGTDSITLHTNQILADQILDGAALTLSR